MLELLFLTLLAIFVLIASLVTNIVMVVVKLVKRLFALNDRDDEPTTYTHAPHCEMCARAEAVRQAQYNMPPQHNHLP
jgi:hypothetical protein